MTCEPVGWGRPNALWSGADWPGADWPGAAWPDRPAAAFLERAEEAVAAALRGLRAADDVAWVSPAAARYRAVLGEAIDGLAAARVRLSGAHAAAARHDDAVELERGARRRELAVGAFGVALGGAG